jgi:signal peptidase II
MRTFQRLTTVLLTLLACVGCDQASKAVIRMSLSSGQRYEFLGGAFRLERAQNPGAFLSMGSSWPPAVRELVLTVGMGMVVTGLMLWAAFGRGLSTSRRLCVAAIAAGGAGNLIDRILQGGTVTDFLYLGVGPVHTGIFNLADMILMLGLLGFLFATRHDGAA